MPEDESRKRRRRWDLRGMMALVAVVALTLVVILPRFSTELKFLERHVRVKLNEDDLHRHVDILAIQQLVEDFARTVRSGQAAAALELTTSTFRKRTTPDQLRVLAAEVGLDRGPCNLVEATCSFPLDGDHFISEYAIRCGPVSGPNLAVKLVVITEAGWLRVDRVESGSK